MMFKDKTLAKFQPIDNNGPDPLTGAGKHFR